MQFYFAQGDQQRGPLPIDQLRPAGVAPDTLVWREGMQEWTRADRVPELASLFAPQPQQWAPPPTASHAPPPPAGYPGAPAAMHAPPAYGAPSYPQQQPMPQQYPSAPVYPPQQGYPQPMGYMPPQYGTPQVNPGQGLGVASMVLGILALPLMCLKGVGLLAAIAAVIMGHIAHAQSKRANGQANGMALAGLICGYISLAIVVLIFVFVLVVIGSFAAASRRF